MALYWIVKRSVAGTLPNKASVHTRNATFKTISALEQEYVAPFLKDVISKRNEALVTVHTVPDQFLRRSVSLPVQCEHSLKEVKMAKLCPESDTVLEHLPSFSMVFSSSGLFT